MNAAARTITQNSAHTPGTWTFDDNTNTVRDSGDALIASVRQANNGPVLATAPELLEALRGMVDLASDLISGEYDIRNKRYANNTITAARAALAKAGA